jgi:hypothetical protein
MRLDVIFSILLSTTFVVGCSLTNTTPYMGNRHIPTPASTLPEIVHDISSDDMAVRLVSLYELEKYGDEAILALPALRDNLYVDDYQVQIAAIIAISHLGSSAKSAVPDLVYILHNDPYIHTRDEAASALGFVGDRTVVPELAIALFAKEKPYESDYVAISCSVSIARITGEKFTDFDSKYGYLLDENGVALIVIDARKWWQEEGQFEDWSNN